MQADYLLTNQAHVHATDASKGVDNRYSHDKISQMLYHADADHKKLYRQT